METKYKIGKRDYSHLPKMKYAICPLCNISRNVTCRTISGDKVVQCLECNKHFLNPWVVVSIWKQKV